MRFGPDGGAPGLADVSFLVGGDPLEGGGIVWTPALVPQFGTPARLRGDDPARPLLACEGHRGFDGARFEWWLLRLLYDRTRVPPRTLPLVRPEGRPWAGGPLPVDALCAILRHCDRRTAAACVCAAPPLARRLKDDLAACGIAKLAYTVGPCRAIPAHYRPVTLIFTLTHPLVEELTVRCLTENVSYSTSRKAYRVTVPGAVAEEFFTCYLSLKGAALAYLLALGMAAWV